MVSMIDISSICQSISAHIYVCIIYIDVAYLIICRFLIDFCGTFPVYLLDSNDTSLSAQQGAYNQLSRLARLPRILKILRFLRIIKVFRVFRLNHYWAQIQNTFKIDRSIIRLAQFYFWVIFGLHMISCIWFFLANFNDFEPDSWVFRRFCVTTLQGCSNSTIGDMSRITMQEWKIAYQICSQTELYMLQDQCGTWAFNHAWTCYLDGVYWAYQTLATVGYGDVPAFTDPERLFALVVMLLGVSMYAFTISNLSGIIANIDSGEKPISIIVVTCIYV